jgi:hypothetical protein
MTGQLKFGCIVKILKRLRILLTKNSFNITLITHFFLCGLLSYK